jgi:endonuclease-3
MQEMFRDYPETELIYHSPFQLLMSVMLSAQTTDKQVNKVTAVFYDRVRSPQDVLELSEDEFYLLIR